MTPGRPLNAASHFFRYSRAWRPVSLSWSDERPWEAYASMNSYASSMMLMRELSSATVSGLAHAWPAGFALELFGPTGQRLGSWCSRYCRRVMKPRIIDFVIHHFSGRTAK